MESTQVTQPVPPPESPQQADKPASTRRKGKVARPPKAVRDELNTMLVDGVPYLQIIERLGPDAQDLNEQNLSNWKSGGYLDWLRFVNSMVRLAEGSIKCELHKFRSQDRAEETARRKRADEPRGISEEALRKAEQALKLPSNPIRNQSNSS